MEISNNTDKETDKEVIVKKFGGTSVATVEKIELIADKIAKFYQTNKKLVIVVSAMQGETDKLENLAYKITNEPDLREQAALLATGEQVTISLLAIALIKRGCRAKSYTGAQLGIYTDDNYDNAEIKHINIAHIQNNFKQEIITVVAGFQGIDKNGSITTLGRGGSDTTAVALAALLPTKECCIYTDVDGVYTADPNLEPNAQKLASIDFNEMLELAGLGAKVMQIRAVAIGSTYQVPIKVLSSFNNKVSGTLIKQNNLVHTQLIKLAMLRDHTKVIINNINYQDIINILNKLTDIKNLDLEIIHSNQEELSFLLANKYLRLCQDVLVKQLKLNNIQYLAISKLSLVGQKIGFKLDLINKIYNHLYTSNIVINQIITAETKVSLLLHEKDVELAMKILHKTFEVAEYIDI